MSEGYLAKQIYCAYSTYCTYDSVVSSVHIVCIQLESRETSPVSPLPTSAAPVNGQYKISEQKQDKKVRVEHVGNNTVQCLALYCTYVSQGEEKAISFWRALLIPVRLHSSYMHVYQTYSNVITKEWIKRFNSGYIIHTYQEQYMYSVKKISDTVVLCELQILLLGLSRVLFPPYCETVLYCIFDRACTSAEQQLKLSCSAR